MEFTPIDKTTPVSLLRKTGAGRTTSRRRLVAGGGGGGEDGGAGFHFDEGGPLHFYRLPPTGDISLQEFAELADERLKLLRAIERANLSGNSKFSDDWKQALVHDLQKDNLKFYLQLSKSGNDPSIQMQVKQNLRRDHISHFILRLVYYKTSDLQRWFINQETDLFKWRFLSERAENRAKCLDALKKNNDFPYEPITDVEKSELSEKILSSMPMISSHALDSMDVYRVPFYKVPDLVRSRKCFLEKGNAYITSDELVTLVGAMFRAHISKALALTSKLSDHFNGDERISETLSNFDLKYTGRDYTNNDGSEVLPEQLDKLSLESFPPCMSQLHQTLRSKHHLKYGGRMQYGLFLKGIGLSLESSLKFWRQEFLHTIGEDKFAKEYAYNIRHNYGKEGKRANYTPYSCIKIIMGSVGADDNHGCPFRHFDMNSLKQKVLGSNRGFTKANLDEIEDLVRKSHFQVACQRYFELTHNNSRVDNGIQHPNQYFEESRKALDGGSSKGNNASSKGSLKNVKTTQVHVFPTSAANSQKASVAGSQDEFEELLDAYSFDEDIPIPDEEEPMKMDCS